MKIIIISAVWCPGCIVMHRVWKSVKEKYPNIEFINLDYDMNEEEVQKYDPGKLLPVTIFVKDDIEVDRLNGEKKEEEIISIIENNK